MSPPLAAALVLASAVIILLLGLAHLVYTFHGPKLLPRDPRLIAQMQADSPVLTRQTTMWRAWIGFNASHSMGALLFGAIYGYLALRQPALLFHSTFLLMVGQAMLLGYLLLAKRYWFSIPFRGIFAATVLYAVAIVVNASTA